jgi:hypothetical protein
MESMTSTAEAHLLALSECNLVRTIGKIAKVCGLFCPILHTFESFLCLCPWGTIERFVDVCFRQRLAFSGHTMGPPWL